MGGDAQGRCDSCGRPCAGGCVFLCGEGYICRLCFAVGAELKEEVATSRNINRSGLRARVRRWARERREAREFGHDLADL